MFGWLLLPRLRNFNHFLQIVRESLQDIACFSLSIMYGECGFKGHIEGRLSMSQFNQPPPPYTPQKRLTTRVRIYISCCIGVIILFIVVFAAFASSSHGATLQSTPTVDIQATQNAQAADTQATQDAQTPLVQPTDQPPSPEPSPTTNIPTVQPTQQTTPKPT